MRKRVDLLGFLAPDSIRASKILKLYFFERELA